MRRIGKTISAFCRVGGWLGPMYGAARLERKNIGEYERAAGYAARAGHRDFVDDLIDMSEVEWDHERFFRGEVREPLAVARVSDVVGPGPKATIRQRASALDPLAP